MKRALVAACLAVGVIEPTSLSLAQTQAPPGQSFDAQMHTMFRVAVCGSSTAPIPARLDPRMVARHCKQMKRRYRDYHRWWASKVSAFLPAVRPARSPSTVVYPFGGGDLSTALLVFPDAREITTVSLEAAGDPRPIDTIPAARMARDLGVVGHKIERLFRSAHSSTKSLMVASHSRLPGTLMFALAAMAAHGYEPLWLRYFTIEPSGTIRYMDASQIAAADRALIEGRRMRRKHGRKLGKKHGKVQIWNRQYAAFENMEIGFRRRGTTERRVYRHIVANLDNNHLSEDDRVIKHLRAKGKVAAMTKAASFLLWMDEFAIVRSYLLGNVQWMISDATGLPPDLAAKAGFEQIPFGRFVAPWFRRHHGPPPKVTEQFTRLWKKSQTRLDFRFGYPDARGNNHLLITRRKRR